MLKTVTAAAAVAAAFVAAPAMANEARVELRGGAIFIADEEEATAGLAAGYDFDLGSAAFVGAEVAADKVLITDSNIYVGLTGRAGAKLGNGRLFAAAGYTFGEGEDVPHLGAGYEHTVAGTTYIKAEYRHFFSDFLDADAVSVGIGARF